uniref:Uncharacterized protein n=1 Tax=viral metagenome TaxID=1070528 RepID=A0A6C0LNU1_9ZZZZ
MSTTQSEIIYHLDCLIKIFKDLKTTNADNAFYTKQEITQNLFFFTNKKERLERMACVNAQSETQNTHACCEHEFVNDYIDLTPEKSERVVYCRFCDLTL